MPPKRVYWPRALEGEIRKAVRQFPVLALTGPRQTGKSTLLKNLFPAHNQISLDDEARRLLAKKDPALFLEELGEPCIIDEIQKAPEILSHIKLLVDRDRGRKGRFLLTGSQVFPLMAGLSESLAGRAALFELLGLSWEEMPGAPYKTGRECFRRIWGGFYPDPVVHHVAPKLFYPGYITTYLERDIRQMKSVEDLSLFQTFLQALGARVGSVLNLTDLGRQVGVSHTTARQWLSLLETTRIVYLLRPFSGSLSKRVIKSPKVYFTDTGLLAHLLKYADAETLRAGPLAGAFFENMMVSEWIKRKFNHGALFDLFFFRDSNGNEVDLVLEKAGKRFLVELKMSKTPRSEFAGPFERVADVFPGSPGYVLSFVDKEISLSRRVKMTPWWSLDPVSV